MTDAQLEALSAKLKAYGLDDARIEVVRAAWRVCAPIVRPRVESEPARLRRLAREATKREKAIRRELRRMGP